MLELTLTQGSELKIGDDIRIVFRGGGVAGRVRLAVEAPKEKRIERVIAAKPGPEEKQSAENCSGGYRSGRKKEIVIVGNG